MNPMIYILTISLLPVTAIIVFAMKYAASYAAARARAADEAGLRTLAAEAAAAQARTGAALHNLEADVAKLARSLAAVETMLKQVG